LLKLNSATLDRATNNDVTVAVTCHGEHTVDDVNGAVAEMVTVLIITRYKVIRAVITADVGCRTDH